MTKSIGNFNYLRGAASQPWVFKSNSKVVQKRGISLPHNEVRFYPDDWQRILNSVVVTNGRKLCTILLLFFLSASLLIHLSMRFFTFVSVCVCVDALIWSCVCVFATVLCFVPRHNEKRGTTTRTVMVYLPSLIRGEAAEGEGGQRVLL